MIPPTHFLISWVIAAESTTSRRDRAIVTLAGVIPDIDGFGYPIENCLTFHLHLLCDVIGSREIDNYQWPFSNAWQWTWSGQWELSAWPNRAIGAGCFALTLWQAWLRGFSPLEMLSPDRKSVV